jgi:hypothetical protein
MNANRVRTLIEGFFPVGSSATVTMDLIVLQFGLIAHFLTFGKFSERALESSVVLCLFIYLFMALRKCCTTWAISPALLFCILRQELTNFTQEWPQTQDPLASISQESGITGVNHHAQLVLCILNMQRQCVREGGLSFWWYNLLSKSYRIHLPPKVWGLGC